MSIFNDPNYDRCEKEYLETPEDDENTYTCEGCGDSELDESCGRIGVDHEWYCDDCWSDMYG